VGYEKSTDDDEEERARWRGVSRDRARSRSRSLARSLARRRWVRMVESAGMAALLVGVLAPELVVV